MKKNHWLHSFSCRFQSAHKMRMRFTFIFFFYLSSGASFTVASSWISGVNAALVNTLCQHCQNNIYIYIQMWNRLAVVDKQITNTICLVSILIRLTCRETINTYALLAWCPCVRFCLFRMLRAFDMEMNEAVLMFSIGKGKGKCETLCTLHAHTTRKVIIIWLKTITSC